MSSDNAGSIEWMKKRECHFYTREAQGEATPGQAASDGKGVECLEGCRGQSLEVVGCS